MDQESLEITALVAMDLEGVIGRGDALPWQLSSDLKRFKRWTMGHTLLMGRKTFESIGKPLPGRKTIVLTRQQGLSIPGTTVVSDWQGVLSEVPPGQKLFVVGGGEIYRIALPYCQRVLVTRVLTRSEGDVRFPDWDWWTWRCTYREQVPMGPKDQWPTEVELRERGI